MTMPRASRSLSWTLYPAVSMTGAGLRVQWVIMPSGVESATLRREGVVVDPVDRYLAHLTAIERSPNKVKAY